MDVLSRRSLPGRAPSLTLPRNRERGPTFAVAADRPRLNALAIGPTISATRHAALLLPLAGEGWGGGVAQFGQQTRLISRKLQ
jgi:hypothetical protein